MSQLEDDFAFQLSTICDEFDREERVIAGRRFRWDFLIPPNLLIEIQGGTRMKGKTGHTSGDGVRRDCEKNNLAVAAGYKVLYFTSDMIRDGEALATVEKLLEGKCSANRNSTA
jgi:hypothetical protein